jgi:hypothetical protein
MVSLDACIDFGDFHLLRFWFVNGSLLHLLLQLLHQRYMSGRLLWHLRLRLGISIVVVLF